MVSYYILRIYRALKCIARGVEYVIVLPRSPGIYGCKLPEREGAARG